VRGDARDPAREVAQRGCDFAELVRRAFELTERSGLIGGGTRDVLRAFAIPT
jgi:hypothetical protein